MKLAAIGIDLAKAVFQVHGVDERGKVLFRIAWAVLAHERTYQYDYVATRAAGA